MKLVRGLTLSILCLVLAASAVAAQNNIYVAQNATGADSGAGCSNAHSAAWFNNPANWAGGASQIRPGTTVHLCGTFTGATGSTMLTVAGNGSPGSPITILFEANARLTSPAWNWNGAIYLNGNRYIAIDGGTSGIIENTANGTSKQYHQASNGIAVISCNDIEIKNLTIQNIYVNEGNVSSASDTAGASTRNIEIEGDNTNISIHDNRLNNARSGVSAALAKGFTGLHIYNNTLSDHAWGIMAGEGSGGFTGSDFQIYGNTITNWTNWQWPTATYHTDGIIVYVSNGSSLLVNIYNNYIYGSLGAGSPTAFIFCTYGSTAPGVRCNIFNNLLVSSGGQAIWIQDGQAGNNIFNNTMLGSGVMINVATSRVSFKNNVVSGYRALSSYNNLSTQITASDNNVFYKLNSKGYWFSYNDGRGYYNWGQWRALGFDANSSTADPRLNASYEPQAGSSAIGRGSNLSSVGLVALNWDKAGVPRPPTGACTPGVAGCWDSGALQAFTGHSNPAGFLSLKAVVH